ncbi:MAG: glutathionylspermidine synthase family protein [Pseudomonadota bacterium]|nr:glutathionylspermidine synthase family protein [Pseudomonadota bacterium]
MNIPRLRMQSKDNISYDMKNHSWFAQYNKVLYNSIDIFGENFMERLVIKPRADWQSQVESLGLSFHSPAGNTYWNEAACYRFRSNEIAEIKKSTNEIEKLCLHAVDHVIQKQRFREFSIPEHAQALIVESWQRGDRALYGRLDLSYDGTQPPKLLEYNADTPRCLLEASIIQRHWHKQVQSNTQQYNSIHEQLVEAWSNYGQGLIHVIGIESWPEDMAQLTYLANTIREAGLTSRQVSIEKIDWNGHDFVDTENTAIKTMFKLYPWEILIEEGYRTKAEQATLHIIEPIWKMILTNKALLVILWELFPNHPNLLPTFFDPKYIDGDYVMKALFGRQGQNITICSELGNITCEGSYHDGPFIAQQAHPLPKFDGNHAVIGSWLIAGESAGIGIREDDTPITRYLSRFVPHYFE